MTDIIQKGQHFGPHGNTIFNAVAAVRDVVAYSELYGTPLCILSIDFKEALDKISHEYLFDLLRMYGFSERFQRRIKGVYDLGHVIHTNKWAQIPSHNDQKFHLLVVSAKHFSISAVLKSTHSHT